MRERVRERDLEEEEDEEEAAAAAAEAASKGCVLWRQKRSEMKGFDKRRILYGKP